VSPLGIGGTRRSARQAPFPLKQSSGFLTLRLPLVSASGGTEHSSLWAIVSVRRHQSTTPHSPCASLRCLSPVQTASDGAFSRRVSVSPYDQPWSSRDRRDRERDRDRSKGGMARRASQIEKQSAPMRYGYPAGGIPRIHATRMAPITAPIIA
jgi:hypothetical protein